MSKHTPPHWLLERAKLDELPEWLDDERRRSLEGADDALLELRADDEARLASGAARRAADAIDARVGRRRAKRRMALAGSLVTASAALLFLLLPDRGGSARPTVAIGHDTEVVRAKGDAATLRLHLRVGDQSRPLTPDDRVRAGDVLQVEARAPGMKHALVLSYDGSGAISLHWPPDEGESTLLPATHRRLLPHSFELDDAPHFEHFIYVASEEEIAVSPLLDSLRLELRSQGAAQKPLPAIEEGQRVRTATAIKEERP